MAVRKKKGRNWIAGRTLQNTMRIVMFTFRIEAPGGINWYIVNCCRLPNKGLCCSSITQYCSLEHQAIKRRRRWVSRDVHKIILKGSPWLYLPSSDICYNNILHRIDSSHRWRLFPMILLFMVIIGDINITCSSSSTSFTSSYTALRPVYCNWIEHTFHVIDSTLIDTYGDPEIVLKGQFLDRPLRNWILNLSSPFNFPTLCL